MSPPTDQPIQPSGVIREPQKQLGHSPCLNIAHQVLRERGADGSLSRSQVKKVVREIVPRRETITATAFRQRFTAKLAAAQQSMSELDAQQERGVVLPPRRTGIADPTAQDVVSPIIRNGGRVYRMSRSAEARRHG